MTSVCYDTTQKCEIDESNDIDHNVVIHDNVIIGKNNTIKSGTIIFPNTVIGDNNVIMENNIIGSLPVEANLKFEDLRYNGLVIGDNNLFHVRNIISTGCQGKTVIGNNNKILSDVYLSHDNIVGDNVTFYPRVFSAGLVRFYDNCSIGAGANIHQKLKVGYASMIGMNSTITKNVMPYMICINNRYTRLNTKKLEQLNVEYMDELKTVEQLVLSSSLTFDKISSLSEFVRLHFNDITN